MNKKSETEKARIRQPRFWDREKAKGIKESRTDICKSKILTRLEKEKQRDYWKNVFKVSRGKEDRHRKHVK
ncbi:hypothetical protein ScPMuIL_012359 [Solemya velum]